MRFATRPPIPRFTQAVATTDTSLWVSEYGWIRSGRSNRCLPRGDLELKEADFESLECLLEAAELDEGRDALPIRYVRRAGVPAFKVENHVGLIRTGGGTHIEILPKLSRDGKPEECRELLLKMLIELEDSPFREAAAADLDAHEMPLFELLLGYFLQRVAELIRRGVARDFVRQEGNLNRLRGKILVRENIRANAANAACFYCEYEEFVADRPVNRLIRGALDKTAGLTRLPRNQQLCRELQAWFEDVPEPEDWRLDFQRIRWDRDVTYYRKAMPVCRLLYERLNPLTRRGENRAVSMLFPMEKVFENYVAARLPRQYPNWRIRLQSGGGCHLVDDHAGRAMFALQPDLLFERGDTRVVADTKWKLIDENDRDRKKKYGISQADVYQLFGYSRKVLGDCERPLVILIYPRHEKFTRSLPEFAYEIGGSSLLVVPFDLEDDKLLWPEGKWPLSNMEAVLD